MIKRPTYSPSSWTEILQIAETDTVYSRSYTAPENGWIKWYLVAARTPIHVSINGAYVAISQVASADTFGTARSLAPVSKGDRITLWTGSSEKHGYGTVDYQQS